MLDPINQTTFLDSDEESHTDDDAEFVNPDSIHINIANIGVSATIFGDENDDDSNHDCMENSACNSGSSRRSSFRDSALDPVPETTVTEGNLSANRGATSLAISSRTDSYGFFIEKSRNVPRRSIEKYRQKQEERSGKWLEMTKKWDFYMRRYPKVVKRRIRKGIPAEWRGNIWNRLGKVDDYILKYPGTYQQLCNQNSIIAQEDPTNSTHDTIERDINRTFPKHKMFTSETREGMEGLDRLRRVLRAYSLFDTEVQYCQGMGFFTAMFLMYMEEEHAFWQLVSVMHRKDNAIRGLFLPHMADTRQALSTASNLTKKYLPKLYDHFEEQNLDFTMFATDWYLTIYTSSFPFELATRVWDSFLSEGLKVVHRVAIGLLKCFQTELLSQQFEEALHTLRHKLPECADVEAVLDAAFSLPLKKKRVKKYEDRWIKTEMAEEEERNSRS